MPAGCKGLSDRLRTLAKPRDLEDLKAVAGQLRVSSEKLKQLAEKVLKYDQKSHLENLVGLARYNGELAAQAIQLSKQMERPDKPKDRAKLDLELEDLTTPVPGLRQPDRPVGPAIPPSSPRWRNSTSPAPTA